MAEAQIQSNGTSCKLLTGIADSNVIRAAPGEARSRGRSEGSRHLGEILPSALVAKLRKIVAVARCLAFSSCVNTITINE